MIARNFERLFDNLKQSGIALRKTVRARPTEIDAFEEERRYIRSRRYKRTRDNLQRTPSYTLHADLRYKYIEIHFAFAEQCEKNPDLYGWIKDLDTLVAKANESIEDLNRKNAKNP